MKYLKKYGGPVLELSKQSGLKKGCSTNETVFKIFLTDNVIFILFCTNKKTKSTK